MVRKAVFEQTYELHAVGDATGDGLYRKRETDPVFARRLDRHERIERPGQPPFAGEPGDWKVWRSGPASDARYVANAFAESYALDSVPVFVELEGLSTDDEQRARALLLQLQGHLAATRIVCRSTIGLRSSLLPRPWLRVAPRPASTTAVESMTITLADLERCVARSRETFGNQSIASFTVLRVRVFFGAAKDDDAGTILASQLAAVDYFNTIRSPDLEESQFLRRCDARDTPGGLPHAMVEGVAEPVGLGRLWEFGAIADHWAGVHQRRWQRTVFGTTRELASFARRSSLGRFFALLGMLCRPTLVLLGLAAAFAFATFGEWSAGCEPDHWYSSRICTSAIWKHFWEPGVFLFAYLPALVSAWLLFASTKTGQDESRHRDLRLLAECMRSRYVGSLLRIRRCVTAYLDELPEGEAAWVHSAVRAIHDAQPVILPAASTPEALARAQVDFITHQSVYHERTLLVVRRDAMDVLAGYSRGGMLVFALALILMTGGQLFELFQPSPSLDPWIVHVLTSTIVVSLAFWGAMRKVADVQGLEAEIQRAHRVLRSLQSAAATPQVRRHTVDALRVFIEDQAKWHRLHRDKPIEAATGT